jgi:hypothetical protein
MTTIEQHTPSSLPPRQDAPVTITLSAAEARLVCTALRLLRDTYTRHDGMHPVIHTILERLPAPDTR